MDRSRREKRTVRMRRAAFFWLAAVLLLISGCRRRSAVPETAAPATGQEESVPASSSASPRTWFRLVMPDVQTVAELTAQAAGPVGTLREAAALLAGMPEESLSFEDSPESTNSVLAYTEDRETFVLLVTGGNFFPAYIHAERRNRTGQITTSLIEGFVRRGQTLNADCVVVSPLRGEALPNTFREDVIDAVRLAVSGLDLSLQEKPSLMVELNDEELAAMYQEAYGDLITTETVSGVVAVEPYKEGQGGFYIVWETQAEGIPVLTFTGSEPTTLAPGGRMVLLANENGPIFLEASGAFLHVTGRGEPQAFVPAKEAAVKMQERIRTAHAGGYELKALRLCYVPFPDEEADEWKLIPCWAGEAQYGSFWEVHLLHAVTGEWLN